MSNNISFKDVFIKGAVIYNPVLIQLVGLCPVVAASTTLARAVMLSVVLCIELIVTCVIASAFFKNIPRWVRVPLYLIIGTAIICPVLWYIETRSLINLSLGMKIYVPLIAVNSMTAVHCEQFSVKNSVRLSFYDAAAAGVGASIVFVIVGAVRELLGNSAIGGMQVNLPITFKGMALPFGCLILLGFMAAALKSFVAKFYHESSETENPVIEGIPYDDENSEVTEVEIFEEFWTEPEEPQEVPEVIPKAIPEKQPTESPKPSFGSVEEIDDFFRSLGIDVDTKGDGQ